MELDPNDITYLAYANHRAQRRIFGVKQRDRRSHMYIIGKTGTGKSTLLRNMVLQDIEKGRGLALFDPHGDLVSDVLAPELVGQRDDVVLLDTPKQNWTFNPLLGVPPGQESLAVAEFVEVFRKIWAEDWGPRLEHLLRNVIFTLLESPKPNLRDVGQLLNDKDYREPIARSLSNLEVREFWLREYARYSPAFRAVVIAPLQNKLGALLTDPRLRAIITAEQNSFDLRDVIDTGKVLLVNLARGRIGEGPASVLGSFLAARIGLAGIARADLPEVERRDFAAYLDEFHLFATPSLASMLAELRKYRVSLVLANQYLEQLDAAVRDAVFGNAGTLISFRISARDAAYVARELAPVFDSTNLIALPNYNIYIKLMIDGEVARPFSAETLHLVPATLAS